MSAQDNVCPDIIPRGGWSARAPRFIPPLAIRPAPFVVVHPANNAPCTTLIECAYTARNIQTFQMDVNGWPDVSYHFMIGSDYRIYEGRGWGRMGENVEGFNNQAINVALMGTFLTQPPTARLVETLDALIACGVSQGSLAQDVAVIAQCQANPRIVSCERTTIFGWAQEHPRFVADPRPV